MFSQHTMIHDGGVWKSQKESFCVRCKICMSFLYYKTFLGERTCFCFFNFCLLLFHCTLKRYCIQLCVCKYIPWHCHACFTFYFFLNRVYTHHEQRVIIPLKYGYGNVWIFMYPKTHGCKLCGSYHFCLRHYPLSCVNYNKNGRLDFLINGWFIFRRNDSVPFLWRHLSKFLHGNVQKKRSCIAWIWNWIFQWYTWTGLMRWDGLGWDVIHVSLRSLTRQFRLGG